MKKIMINVGGKDYPCRLTMGAILLFRRNMGKDVSQMDEQNLEDLLMLMWCCVVCACKAEGVEFDMDFETFTCNVTPQDMTQWNEAIGQENEKAALPRVSANAATLGVSTDELMATFSTLIKPSSEAYCNQIINEIRLRSLANQAADLMQQQRDIKHNEDGA